MNDVDVEIVMDNRIIVRIHWSVTIIVLIQTILPVFPQRVNLDSIGAQRRALVLQTVSHVVGFVHHLLYSIIINVSSMVPVSPVIDAVQ